MSRAKTAMRAFAAGAAVMYFADPDRGRRRRAITRDKSLAALHDVRNELDKARRDARNRAYGFLALARTLWRHEVDNSVLVERVRSRIGRAVSHPHAITVIPEAGGRIILDGPVLEHELDYLLRAVRSVAGVREVVSRLEPHREASGISSLQGGVRRRPLAEFAQENWTPTLRVAAGALAGWAFYSSLRNQGPRRWLGTAVGAALLARAVANKGFRQILGVSGGLAVNFEKAIHIDAPAEEVFRFWSNFENFPKFMTHLKEVRCLENGRWHWVAAGPAGMSIPWDAEITESEPNRSLAWRSVPGSLIDTKGVVRFDEEPDGRTRLSIRMSYSPPAGVFGHAVAWVFGADPKSEIDDDMVRFKSLIEVGKTRAHGVTVERQEIAAGAIRGGV